MSWKMALFIFRLLYCKFAIPQFNWGNLFFYEKNFTEKSSCWKKIHKKFRFCLKIRNYVLYY